MSVATPGPGRPLTEVDRLRLLVDAARDFAIYMLDLDGVVTSWNRGAQQLKGYRSGEIIGQHYECFFTPEDRAQGLPARILAEARSKGHSDNEGWRVRKDGGRFWALATLHAVRDDAGHLIGLAKITRDITERHEAQQALFDSERRFRLLVEGVVDYAIYMLDPGGVIVNWNTGAQRIKGYAAEEIIGSHFSRFYTKEDQALGLPARVLDIASRTGRYESEGWRVRKDGSRFWATAVVDTIRDGNGTLLGFAKVTRDITERRHAQEALRESERQFRLLVNGVTDCALYMLDPNGIVTNWNPGAQRIKGYTADEIVGQHFSKFYSERDRMAGLPLRALNTAAEQGRSEAEGWRVRKDGTQFWANVVVDAIRDETGQLVGFAKITRDITERRQAQQALELAQTQLAQAQKMEALGQLTGGVAHDFNNLLMIVRGQLQILKKSIGDDPRALRAAEAIQIATKRGESLTRQLLTFARRQRLNPVVVRLQEGLETLRTMLSSSVGGSTRLAISIAPDAWPVHVDLAELELALVNLVINARDAMPEGGTIAVTVENVRLEASDTAAGVEGEYVALSVIDSGSGIAEDILPKVFDPFFTTKQSGKGTGLGLSQVHGFAHQSGGTATVASKVGDGTRVTIYLPRARSEPAAQADETAAGQATAGGSLLLVEDNPEVAEASQALLEQLGYRVTAVGDAPAALQALVRSSFDLVLSDIVMAGPMNGLALAQEIRERYPDLPIVLATGYSSAAEQAAADFVILRKPYEIADVSRAIAQQIARARQPAGASNLVRFPKSKRARGTKSEPPPGAS